MTISKVNVDLLLSLSLYLYYVELFHLSVLFMLYEGELLTGHPTACTVKPSNQSSFDRLATEDITNSKASLLKINIAQFHAIFKSPLSEACRNLLAIEGTFSLGMR